MNYLKTWLVVCLLWVCLFTAGCPTFVTTHRQPPNKSDTKGLIYYLPMKLLKLTVTRKAVPSEPIKKAGKDAEDAKTAAELAQKASKDATESLNAIKKIEKDNVNSHDAALKAAIAEELSKRTIMAAEKETLTKNAVEKAKKSLEQYENALMVQAGRAEVIQAVNRARLKREEFHNAQIAIEQLPTSIMRLDTLIIELEKTRNRSQEEENQLISYKEQKRRDEKKLANVRTDLSRLIEELKLAELNASAELRHAIDLTTKSVASLFEDDVSVIDLPAIPDTSQMFVANLSHWITREDHLNLTTTPSGLLKTATGESLDKSAQILEDVAKFAIMLATGLPTTGNAIPKTTFIEADETPPSEPLDCADIPKSAFGKRTIPKGTDVNPAFFPGIETKPFSIEFTFDPADFSQVLDVNAQLCLLRTNFLIRVQNKPTAANDNGNQRPQSFDGLVYRRPLPYIVELLERLDKTTTRVMDSPEDVKAVDEWKKEMEAKQKEVATLKKSVVFTLPNGGEIATVSFNAGFFVQSKFDVGFDDGMLTKSEATRPSELHAIAQLPVIIAKDIISVPAELLQLKVNYASKDTDLLNTQKANIEARQKLDKALEEFRSSKTTPATSTTQ